MSAHIEHLVSQYLAYWNQADIDHLMSMYAPDMHYHDLPSGDVIAYRDLKQFLVDVFARETEQHVRLKESVVVEGNSAFLHWTQSFVSANLGRTVSVNGVELIVFRDGRIVSIHEFYDFQDADTDALVSIEKDTLQDKMTKLGLTDTLMTKLADELLVYFETEQPYLRPELTLAMVADALGYTRNQVSFVINQQLKQTFYDLVNTRRVDHAIQDMTSSGTGLPILELAIDSGFSSVSGFYNAFKKRTGKTPAQYRRDLLR